MQQKNQDALTRHEIASQRVHFSLVQPLLHFQSLQDFGCATPQHTHRQAGADKRRRVTANHGANATKTAKCKSYICAPWRRLLRTWDHPLGLRHQRHLRSKPGTTGVSECRISPRTLWLQTSLLRWPAHASLESWRFHESSTKRDTQYNKST